MDREDAEILHIKRTRCKILDLLKMMVPVPLDFETICAAVPLVDGGHVKKDLAYLEEKGYVRCVNEKPNRYFKDRIFKITATGIEIADRITRDPAMEP